MTHVGPISDHPLDDLAAYAIDALDPAEQQAVDDHLVHCAACRAELAGHRETLVALAPAEAPPPEVWRDITVAIGAPGLPDPHTGAPGMAVSDHSASSGPSTRAGRTAMTRSLRSRLWPRRHVLVPGARHRSAGWLPSPPSSPQPAQAGPSASRSAIPATTRTSGAWPSRRWRSPNGLLATLADSEGQPVARVVADDDGAFMLLEALQDLPEGRAYQLWSVGGPEPVSLGMLGRDGTNTVAFRLPPTITELAISVAPTSGDSTPSGGFRASGSVLQ